MGGWNRLLCLVTVCSVVAACNTELEPRGYSFETDYRSGTVDDEYTSNVERGSVWITEVNWAGSVESVGDGFVHHPDDIFIEVQNKFARPVHMTGWQLILEAGTTNEFANPRGDEDSEVRLILPPRENGQPINPNEYVVIAAKRDGAFPNADYFLEDLALPYDRWEITIRDLDNRLDDGAGELTREVFAGAWDGVTVRSMERIQLIFSNRGSMDTSWHTYSYNDWSPGDLHQVLRSEIAPEFRARTFATPGFPNSPDYSGNTSAGTFE